MLGDLCDLNDDNDGVPGATELVHNTSPIDADSDNDNISDGDEYGLDPAGSLDTDGGATIDALDTDDDGGHLNQRVSSFCTAKRKRWASKTRIPQPRRKPADIGAIDPIKLFISWSIGRHSRSPKYNLLRPRMG